MPRRKSLGFLITAFGLVAGGATASGAGLRHRGEESPLHLLVEAFDRVSPRNVIAVMRMELDKPGAEETVQVQIAKDGRQRVDVLAPFQRSGIAIVEFDDLREVYDPDKHTLSIGRSMAADVFEPTERLRLVRKNYAVHMTHGVQVADRKVIRIDATSHYSEVGGVRIFIDPESYFVMRVESVSQAGQLTRHFDTLNVSYPDSIADDVFSIKNNVATRFRETDPVAVGNSREATRKAGFRAISPHVLPFGFVIRKTYVRMGPAYRSIGFNISDGLVAATVFQFNLRNSKSSVKEAIRSEMAKHPGDYFRSGDTIVGIVSELGAPARKRLLVAFEAGISH